MRKPILLAVTMLAIGTAVTAVADTYIYTVGFFGINQEGRIAGGTDSAILCGGGLCIPIVNCNACHSQPADQTRYAKDPETKHLKIHYPKAALRLAESQQITIGSTVVRRVKGVLVVQEPKGPRFQLPPDAYVVKGKDGKPAFITYLGSKPPQPIR